MNYKGDLALLSIPVPMKVVRHANQTIGRHKLDRLSDRPGFMTVNKILDGKDVKGVANCEHRFDEFAEWPDRQDWDGITATWIDQSDPMDNELAAMFC